MLTAPAKAVAVTGVIAMSPEPLAAFTIAVKGLSPIYLPQANIYGIQDR